ncbi:unnamed protein product [Lepeophtheirus salmonis]|uniref:(salmon louse) hypothetical protein n=1 Tax=Lepeophtheirus salmonis TaxID=72036 RepID=A0A7R8HD55_LEPSM|nr:unnamed protein product [Lepeophtheirus salmonis]CAF3016591.1 unnamed protein product [Lepeophtheirus salmonis]
MPGDLREKLNSSRGLHFKDLDLRSKWSEEHKEKKKKKKRSKSKEKKKKKSSRRGTVSTRPLVDLRRPIPASVHYTHSHKEKRRPSPSAHCSRKKLLRSSKSWSDKVNDFVASLNVNGSNLSRFSHPPPPLEPHFLRGADPSPPKSPSPPERLRKEESTREEVCTPQKESTLLPPGVEFEGTDYESNPLVRFIGRKLRLLKSFYPEVNGSRQKRWDLLQEAGYGQSELYKIAVTSPTQLEMQLKTVVFTGKVKLDGNPKAIQKVLRVIECIKDYFTSKGGEEEEIESQESDNDEEPINKCGVIGPLLKRLNQAAVKKEKELSSPVKPIHEPPCKEELNPWSRMSDALQSQNLASFQNIKNSIAKDLLRIHGRSVDAFNLAQEMVSCWVVAGFGLDSLRHYVIQTPAENILPRNQNQFVTHQRNLYNNLLQRLMRHKSEFSQRITQENLEHLVLKAPNNEHMNIIFNYLPPGLREAENSSFQPNVDPYVEEKSEKLETKSSNIPEKVKGNEEVLSTDPLNAVLNPPQDSLKPNQLPNRKYNLVTLHFEWVILKGIPQIYEISAYSSSDMSVLNLYIVTPSLMKSSATLENLGFVSNPDRHEFYYVQVGIGCVKALKIENAIHKLGSFLEEKRNCSDSENRNNGLSYGGDEVFYESEVKKGINVQNLISKSKSEALYMAIQYLLDNSYPNYSNFISSYCVPSFSPIVESMKNNIDKKEYMHLYLFEIYGIKHLFLRIASFHCSFKLAMTRRIFQSTTLRIKTLQSPQMFFLDSMNMSQRLKVMDQTMRCIHIIKDYYSQSTKKRKMTFNYRPFFPTKFNNGAPLPPSRGDGPELRNPL